MMSAKSTLIRLSTALIMMSVLLTGTLLRNRIWRTETGLFEDAAANSPFKARLHYNLGCHYRSVGLYQQAEREYHVALWLEPGHPEVLFNLGLLYLDMGAMDEARHAFELLVEQDPDNQEAKAFLGSIANTPAHSAGNTMQTKQESYHLLYRGSGIAREWFDKDANQGR